MNHRAPQTQIVSLLLALASSLTLTACSLSRPVDVPNGPTRPPAGLTFQQQQQDPSPALPQPAGQYPPGYHAPPQYAPNPMAGATGYDAAAVIQRTSAEVPVPSTAPITSARPSQPVGYAAPRGMPLPPCGPGCAPPSTVCYHGAPWGACPECRQAFAGPTYTALPCWPEDEYLYDGGDRLARVEIDGDFGVHGLDLEDTVGHYDTLDGRRVVAPSNRVCLYAPRFAAVRKVAGLNQEVLGRQLGGIDANLKLRNQQHGGTPAGVVQPLALQGEIGNKSANALEENLPSLMAHNFVQLQQFREDFAPYENLSIIRYGTFDQGDKPRLAASLQNAVAWTENQQVQVTIEGRKASEVALDQGAQELIWADIPPGQPKLRVVKVASQGDAQPGDIVEFTLRFDNIGDQVMGNVTLIDNLTPRLELIEDSVECSLEANFMTQPNEAGSLVLRWEITDPLKVGEGGICRFQCRVR